MNNKTLPKLRSDMKDRMNLEWMANRAFFRGLGYSDEEIEKPHIGIVNTWNEMNPGHIHQREIADAVREGILSAGGRPFLFYGLSLCDSIGMGPYVLPSRDLLVNEIELICEAHKLDALVLIGTCDKITPAMLMAAGRLDVPTIIVTGGYMETGKLNGQNVDFIDIGASISMVKEGRMSEGEFDQLLHYTCPGCGACGMMGTANTMNILSETIGMSLPGNSTAPARSGRVIQIARAAGMRVVELWKGGIKPHQIITENSIMNAIKVCMAIGGSSNTIIHIPAVATESGIEMDCSEIYAKSSCEIPLLIGIRPNGVHTMKDFDEAGGLGALLSEMRSVLDLSTINVCGKSMGEIIKDKKVLNQDVICSLEKPHDFDGGLILCKGNLVPEGAFIKQGAVPKKLHKFRGPAKVFNNPDLAIEALRKGQIHAGDAVLIIFQGLKGGPATAYTFTTALKGSSLKDDVITITDGRLSGAASGACFGYASPEAALKGPLCAVRDGDMISYDIEKRVLNVELTESEIEKRIQETQIELPKKKGYLGIYQKCVGSILKGGVLSGDS
ncbi:dihydroxy-acid dehydratase [Aminivibrio sp.]|jgi:dihydroxy-acid dehydratase|uniref:dihydroxy-acid dehydratase n=1 Tax=Aminivibrio sp. TaxID=1872489 RepID=UPI003D96DA4D